MKIDPIITDRLIIREFQAGDFDAIHFYASDSQVVEYMDWGPNSEVDTQEFLKKQFVHQKELNRTVYEPAVTLKDSGQLIGGGGITLENDYGILGYCFDKRYWGNGYATEFTKALMVWGKKELGLKYFKATCDVLNEASRHVLEKCGFKIVSKKEKHVQVRGRWRDTYFLEAVDEL